MSFIKHLKPKSNSHYKQGLKDPKIFKKYINQYEEMVEMKGS